MGDELPANAASCPGSRSTSPTASTPTTARRPWPSCSTAAAGCWSTTSCSAPATRPATRSTPPSPTPWTPWRPTLQARDVTVVLVSKAPLAKL